MKRRAFLATLLLATTLLGTTTLLTACMSPEQLAETARRIKQRREEIDEKNPAVPMVYSKHDIAKGTLINDDDIEDRTVRPADTKVPDDAAHNRHAVILKKAKNDIPAGQPICQHDLAPLVGN